MNKNTFTVRDFVNVGMFSVLILIFFWIGGMIGFFPYFMPIVPFAATLLAGPVYMLYTTKIRHMGMITITNILLVIIFIATGHGVFTIPGAILSTILEEYLLRKGNYQSLKYSRFAYTVRGVFAGGIILPIYLTRDAYYDRLIESGYGAEFADQLLSVMPMWSFVPIILLAMVGGYIGATIGLKLFHKHFKKAGIAE